MRFSKGVIFSCIFFIVVSEVSWLEWFDFVWIIVFFGGGVFERRLFWVAGLGRGGEYF